MDKNKKQDLLKALKISNLAGGEENSNLKSLLLGQQYSGLGGAQSLAHKVQTCTHLQATHRSKNRCISCASGEGMKWYSPCTTQFDHRNHCWALHVTKRHNSKS